MSDVTNELIEVDLLPDDATCFGLCPECDEPLAVALDAGGVPTEVLHLTPLCERYVTLGGDGFVHWVLDVREAAQRPAAEA